MCVVSMIMDHYKDRWYPLTQQYPALPTNIEPQITDEEIREFRRLLERARKYDRDNGQPECELEEKKAALKKIADQMGVDISFIDAQ